MRTTTARIASLRVAPAASSSATAAASSAASSVDRRRGRPGDHQRDLALHALGRPLGQLGQRPAADLLVGLGQLPADRGLARSPEGGRGVGERVGQPVRRLEEDHRAALVGQRRQRDRRSPPLRGRKPSKQNRSTGSPETASAVVTADGPGTEVTGTPASIAARTSV